MGELAPAMGTTRFVRWTITGTDGPPSWASALAGGRLGSECFQWAVTRH